MPHPFSQGYYGEGYSSLTPTPFLGLAVLVPCCQTVRARAADGSTPVSTPMSYVWCEPADSITQAWLENHLNPVFGFPPLVRFSWQTASRLLEEHAVNVKWYAPPSVQPPIAMCFWSMSLMPRCMAWSCCCPQLKCSRYGRDSNGNLI